MANIPTIPGTQVEPGITPAESPNLAVQIDPRAGLMAQGQLANTIQTGAKVIGDYEDNKQKAVEFDIANKSYLSFDSLKQEFDKQIPTTPHDELVPKWEEMANTWKAQQQEMYGSKLTKQAQQEIYTNWDKAIVGGRGQAQVIAERKQQADWKGTFDLTMDNISRRGTSDDLTAGDKVIETGVKLGFLTPDQGEDEKMKFRTKVDENVINSALDYGTIEDKLKTRNMIKDPNQLKYIPENRRSVYLNKIDGKIDAEQTRNGEVYTDLVASGDPEQWPTREQLHEDVYNYRISANREKAILGMMAAKTRVANADQLKIKREQDQNSVAVINNLISNHDWINDTNPDATYKTISDAAANLEPKLQKPILAEAAIKRDSAKRKLKGTEVKDDTEVENQIFKKGEEDYKGGLFRPPIRDAKAWTDKLPKWLQPTIDKLDQSYDTSWEKESTPQQIQEAYTRYAVWQDSMRKYIKQIKARSAKTGEPLSLADLNKHSYELKKTDLEQAVSDQVF